MTRRTQVGPRSLSFCRFRRCSFAFIWFLFGFRPASRSVFPWGWTCAHKPCPVFFGVFEPGSGGPGRFPPRPSEASGLTANPKHLRADGFACNMNSNLCCPPPSPTPSLPAYPWDDGEGGRVGVGANMNLKLRPKLNGRPRTNFKRHFKLI